MADFNIGSILDSLTANTAARQENMTAGVQQQAYDTTQLQQLMTGNIDAARQAVGARTQLAAQKAELESRNASLQERATAIVGLNPDDLNNDFVKSVARYNQAEVAQRSAQEKLSTASSVGLLDNPLTWLFNQLEIPGLERQVAGANAQREGALKDIQARTTMLTQHKSSVMANIADTAKQYNLDLAKATADEAFIKLREEEAKNLSAISSRRMNEVGMRDKIFNMRDDDINKVLAIEDLLARREERKLTFASMVDDRKLKLQAREAEAAAVEQANLNLQRYSQFTGGPALTVDTLKMMPKDQAAHLWTVATTGSMGSSLRDVMEALDRDPTALATIQSSNPAVARTVKGISDGLSSYMVRFANKVGPDGKMVTEKDAYKKAYETYEDEVSKSMNLPGFAAPLNSKTWDTMFNPYRADHKLMMHLESEGNAKFLKDNMVLKAAQAVALTVPGSQEGFTGQNETDVLKSIASRVASREISAKAGARDIVNYYNAAVQIGWDQTQYSVFRLPTQKRYMVGFQEEDIHGRKISADLLNPISVEAMLANLAQADAIRELRRPELLRFGKAGADALMNSDLSKAMRVTGELEDSK